MSSVWRATRRVAAAETTSNTINKKRSRKAKQEMFNYNVIIQTVNCAEKRSRIFNDRWEAEYRK